MSKEDIAKLLAVIQIAYPNYHPGDMAAAINLWHEMLNQYDYGTAQQALKTYISEEHEFAPSIGQLIDKIYYINHPMEEEGSEAWARVSMAIRDSAYNAEKEFAALPEAVQRAVGSAHQLHEWALMDSETVESVIQSNFLRNYKTIIEREKSYEKLPADIKERLIETSNRLEVKE